MLKEMHHTGLSVTDMERSLGLYRDILGMEVQWDAEIEGIPEFGTVISLPGVRERIAMLRLNNCRLELFQFYQPKGKKLERRQCDLGYMHVAFIVDELDNICRRLKENGIEFYSEPQNLGPYKVVFFKGYDGETIELMMPTIRTREEKGKGKKGKGRTE
jgi:catechol 2,3-dioxygenase-like lactoylglutathione lyase family enzyme